MPDLKLDLTLHPTPSIAAFLSNPRVTLTLEDLRVLLPEIDMAPEISQFVSRGQVERVGPAAYRLVKIPDPYFSRTWRATFVPSRPLQLDRTLHPSPIIAAFLSNPGLELTYPELDHLLSHQARLPDSLARLVRRKTLARTPGSTVWDVYHLLRTPSPTQSRSGMQRGLPKEQRTRAPKPAPQPRPRKPAPQKPVKVVLTDDQQERLNQEKKQKRAQEALERTAKFVQEDGAAILVVLQASPEGVSEGDLRAKTGLNRGRLQQAMRALRDQGITRTTRRHVADVYQLVQINLPRVFVALTPTAQRVADHLARRPRDTVPFMAEFLRLSRMEVECALGALRHLGCLGWTAVEHLVIYRLTCPPEALRNAAD